MFRYRAEPRRNGIATRVDSPAMAAIVVVDQVPLRQSAAAACNEAMERLEHARIGWHRFEREDKPAFARWRAREFGPLLSKARDIEIQIRDQQALVHEVETEMRRGFQDAHTAYRRVMSRRENPSAAPDDETAAHEQTGAARRVTEFEKEALFQDWVQRSLGTNPDKMDDDAYATTFEAFKSHMFRAPAEEARISQNTARRAEAMREAPEEDEEEQAAIPVDARVKELYRTLVRRLHPDLRANGNAAVSALWHEVQEAYAASDVPRLEILLAISDIQTSDLAAQTTVFQMRTLVTELERAIRALEKSLVEAQGEDAWNFARTGPNEQLRIRVQRELMHEFAVRTARLELLARTIAAWAQGPIANRHVVVNGYR